MAAEAAEDGEESAVHSTFGQVKAEGEDEEILRETIGTYTSIASSFRRKGLYEQALKNLRAAFASCEALRDAPSNQGVLRPGILLLKAKTRLNMSAIMAVHNTAEEAYQEAIRAKEELSRLLLAWWEQTPPEERPVLYAQPVHIEVAATLVMAFRAMSTLLAAQGEPAARLTARAYHDHALRTANALLPRAHALVSLLQKEAAQREYASIPRSETWSSSLHAGSAATTVKERPLTQGQLPNMQRGSFPAHSAMNASVSSSWADAQTRKLSALDQDLRPNTSPAALAKQNRPRTMSTKELAPVRVRRPNPFDDFMSSSDLDALIRKRIMLEDGAQKDAKSSFRHKSSMHRDELRSRGMDELYDNRVLFSDAAMKMWEAEHGWSSKDRGPNVTFGDALLEKDRENHKKVAAMKRRMKVSQRGMIDVVGDLIMLEKVQEVANTLPKKKKKKPEDDEGGGLRSLVEVEDKKPPRDEKLEALLENLTNRERREIVMLGLTDQDMVCIGRVFLRFQSKVKATLLDKTALEGGLRKKLRDEFSYDRYEGLWKTLLAAVPGFGATEVHFMDLVRWASTYLPLGPVPKPD